MLRDQRGQFVRTLDPMARFLSFCRFDPGSGCVIWTGGQTSGRGHSAPYGSFWFDKRRWFAHRWAAKYIHGLEIDDLQVDHCCPADRVPHPNTLCVEHVQAITPTLNRELQWIRAQVGIDEPPPVFLDAFGDVPFYLPPAWLTV